jgi:hypothetical protein
VLLPGEVAIAYLGPTQTETTPDNGTHPILFKVGPGNFNALPWASALAADVYGWAKASDVTLTVTAVEDGISTKEITFVGTDKKIVLDYLTEAEVNTVLEAYYTTDEIDELVKDKLHTKAEANLLSAKGSRIRGKGEEAASVAKLLYRALR